MEQDSLHISGPPVKSRSTLKKRRSSITEATKKNKASQACSACRKRKVKCDGDQPCTRCQKTASECIFDYVKKTDPPKR
ncbi:hypothetical protein J3Q64DRAFT_1719525 [Phycomyces blakesleeanus]|uniref:Zn(2)-C6 fungal-type domain-containing protein n=1 Tax=Phycomyces blakesleeanus TaxID=4837 RepID=A0ABR3B9C3_PHYBL